MFAFPFGRLLPARAGGFSFVVVLGSVVGAPAEACHLGIGNHCAHVPPLGTSLAFSGATAILEIRTEFDT